MTITCALVALCLQTAQGGYIDVGSKAIPLRLTTTAAASLPDGFAAWKGFSYLAGKAASPTNPYLAVNDWKPVLDAFDSVKNTQGAIWRAKIFVLTRTETAGADINGVQRYDRQSLSPADLESTLESIARVKAYIKAYSDGQIDFVPDITIEDGMLRDDTGEAKPFGQEFLRYYVGACINGGKYEAEDKVFRGPYNSSFLVLPGYTSQAPLTTDVDGTPTAAICLNTQSAFQKDGGALEADMISAFVAQLRDRAMQSGYSGVDFSTDPGDPGSWALTTNVDEPATETILANLRSGQPLMLKTSAVRLPAAPVAMADGAKVSLVSDEQHGTVLQLDVPAGRVQGGVGLPGPSDGSPIAAIADKPTLSFFCKTNHRDPISLRISDPSGKAFWVSVGRKIELPSSLRSGAPVVSASFEPNGQWQKVSIDLRPIAKESGVVNIGQIVLEPGVDALIGNDLEAGAGVYQFDQINFSNDPAAAPAGPVAPEAAGADPESRAAFAAKATTTSPELIALLSDHDPVVRLNAATAYTHLKDPAAETALGADSTDLLAPIEDAAIRALAHQGTDNAITIIRRTLRLALDEHARAVAAMALANTGEAKYAGDITLLFATRNWSPKITAIDALTKVKGADPKLRIAFLRNEDPLVRAEVIRTADLGSAESISALRWHALNDPSDRVRLLSDERLIEAGADKAQDGYKGVRDDSRIVRIELLDYLAQHPSEANRAALQLAVADRYASVRAEALQAFAKMPGDVKIDEVSNVLNDENPSVQLGLLALAKAKGFQLPAETLAKMKASPSPQVVAGASGQ